MGRRTRLVAGLAACVVAATLMITGAVSDGIGLVIGTTAVLAMAVANTPTRRRDDHAETP